MLAHNKEGKLCIEDADGSVELDFSKLVSRFPFNWLFCGLGNTSCNRTSQEMDFSLKDASRLWKASIQKKATLKLLLSDNLHASLEKQPGKRSHFLHRLVLKSYISKLNIRAY